jgi:hypothetical protein
MDFYPINITIFERMLNSSFSLTLYARAYNSPGDSRGLYI